MLNVHTARVAKIEQRRSKRSRDDEQRTAAEFAWGQKFVHVPRLCTTSEDGLGLYAS